MDNLSKRIRFRNACGLSASIVFAGLLGFGGGSLVNGWYGAAGILLGLSIAWLALALTVGDRLMESLIEKRYPMGAKAGA